MSSSAEEDFTCSAAVEVCGSAFRKSYSATIGLVVCSVVCSMIGCSILGGVRVIGVRIDDEEILLKCFSGDLKDFALHQNLQVPSL